MLMNFPRTNVPERQLIGSQWREESAPAFAAFGDWTEKYLAAPEAQRDALLKEGVDLAKARRAAMLDLIEKDPRRALADSIPIAIRDRLPSDIVDELEKRVSGVGDLYRISSYNTDGGQKPYFDYAKLDDNYFLASRYGQRASLFELKSASLQGVSVDNRLAVLDSPVYQPEVGERVTGKILNQTCLYSGNTTTTIGEGVVTDPATAPLQVGNELIALCSEAHAQYIEGVLRAAEAKGYSGITNGGVDLQYLINNIKNPIYAFGGAGGTAWPGMPSTNLTYGNKRAIVYRVQMQNWTAFPSNLTEDFCTNTILGNQCTNCYGGMLSKTVSNQLWEFSWGKVVITQAVATTVLMLPKTRDQYTNNYWGVVLADAQVAAAAAGYDTNADFAVIVHSDLQAATLNACAWGGGGAVWVNGSSCWTVGVLTHEFGHVFGLPHANGWTITDGDTWSPSRTHVEYYDPTDPMGQGNGNYRNHYNSFFKYFIHWYPDTLVSNITTSGTYRVYQFDDFNAPLTNTMALLLKHDPVSSYWIALRGNTTSGTFGSTAYISEVQNNKNDTHLLDFNNPNSDNSNGGLAVGQSYYDYTANLTIKNVAMGGVAPQKWMDFSVSFGEPPAMRGLYRFEGDATDSSTNANHGTLIGGTSFVPGRIHYQAVTFNGVDGCVQIPYSVTNDFSISFWVKTTDVGATGPWYNGKGLIDATVGAAQSDFGITLNGNKAAFGVGTPDTTILSTANINNGQWHHVAATRNSTSGEMRLYIDGTQQAITTGPVGPLALAPRMLIGAIQSGGGFLNGSIDDVVINNFLLSPGEVSALARVSSTAYAAGQLQVDLHANVAMVSTTAWSNQVAVGNFTRVGTAAAVNTIAGLPAVTFNGTSDAFQGPASTSDIDGASDRTIEVWAYNPSLATEETMVSLGHRGSTRRELGFNFGTDTGFGGVTHYNDDLGWGGAPSANAWHHLVYTYSNQVVRLYLDGNLQNTKTLGAALNTFPGEVMNIGCQRDTLSGNRSFLYSGYLNAVRIHGGALTPEQVYANYIFGTWIPTSAPSTPPSLAASPRNGQVRLTWGASTYGAAGYNLKRGTASGGPYTNIATAVTATNYTDTAVINGVTYYYVVTAANFFGQSSNSTEAVAPVTVSPMPIVAGTLYVDLRATDASAAAATWLNQGTLGDFAKTGSASLNNNVAGIPGVLFNGSTDFYQGPASVTDIDGGGDRTVEIWAYNPALASEETPVSWGHRGTTRRNMSFNFGNNGTWGAATHYGDDVGWGTNPTAAAWHHLVYTYATNLVSLYVDGVLRTNKGLAGALDTFPGEPIYVGCQREAGGTSSMFYSGYLNTVRIHGGVLTAAQVQSNFVFGPWLPNSAPSIAPISDRIVTAGAVVTVTPVATDANSSQQKLIFSLPTGPAGAIFATNTGVLNWRPGLAMANTTNPVTIMATDNGVPNLSGSRSFNIMVVPPTAPSLVSPALTNGAFQLVINGDVGPDYVVQCSSNLVDWITLYSNTPPTMPFLFIDPAATNYDQRFYRVFVGGP